MSVDYSFRFGPGRQSRRLQQIERLRELRVHRSAGLARDSVDVPLSRGSTRGTKQFAKQRTGDDTACVRSSDRKRRRESPGEANQVVRQRSSPETSLVATTLSTLQQQQEAPPVGLTPEGAGGGWSRDDPGLNADLKKRSQPRGVAEHCGRRTCLDVFTAPKDPLGSLDEGPGASVGSAFSSESDSPLSTPCAAQILPIRSGPAFRRPREVIGQHSVPLNEERCQQQQHSRKYKGRNSIAKAAAAGGGDKDADGRASSIAGSNAGEVDGGLGAGNEGNVGSELRVGSSAESRSGHPPIADTCGGIILRLNPSERSLEPWGNTLAPLRAMCDIEPSLSRAGMEYRGVMHAVEGAQELKSHHTAKVRTGRYSLDGILRSSNQRSISTYGNTSSVCHRDPCVTLTEQRGYMSECLKERNKSQDTGLQNRWEDENKPACITPQWVRTPTDVTAFTPDLMVTPKFVNIQKFIQSLSKINERNSLSEDFVLGGMGTESCSFHFFLRNVRL